MGNSNIYKVITETVPEFFFVYTLEKKQVTFMSPQFYELANDHQQATHNDKLRSYIHPSCHKAFDRFFNDLSAENDYASRIELQAHEDLGEIRWVEI
jgi:two-component system sensor histidine kinase VicK